MQRHTTARAFKVSSFFALMFFAALLTGTLYAAPKVGPVTPENAIIGQSDDDSISSGGVYSLPNGNIVIVSPDWNGGHGAVTCLFPSEYRSGGIVVSEANSLVGTKADDYVGNGGVTVLANGNYVVSSTSWDNGSIDAAGAVTWVNGKTCRPYGAASRGAVVSAANSLVGSRTGDQVGLGLIDAGVIALTNGNYVVHSPRWDRGAIINAGAVTWGNGKIGIVGVIKPSNSLVGSSANNQIGFRGITALTNGNYVVASELENGGTGAVTWADGTRAITGLVNAANSLVGVNVGRGGITALTNGNYVVASPYWNDVGAATWGNGKTGIVGTISKANSLVGSVKSPGVGSGGVIALTNGNYVVSSPLWHRGSKAHAGAATRGNGKTGTTGVVSAANSLVGAQANDQISSDGIIALSNGHYVVSSPYWDHEDVPDVGAATWGNGKTGTTGVVKAANSLVGATAYDYVGRRIPLGFNQGKLGIQALTNGHYVVSSPEWDDGEKANAGAVTWGNGATGTVGVVNPSNSLIGGEAGDRVGIWGITALSNGSYVVRSPRWNNSRGAATWREGSGSMAGIVSAANSLVGSNPGDSVSSDELGNVGVIALTNGNYVVSSPDWRNGEALFVGAVTWGNGTVGTTGVVSADNSLVGSNPIDYVGQGQIVALPDGDYLVSAPAWDNDGAADAGAVTLGNGTTGTIGTLSAANSLVGSTAGDRVGAIYLLADGSYIVSTPFWDNNVSTALNVGMVIWNEPPGGVEEINYLPNASFENAGTTNKTAAGWKGVGLTQNDKRICNTETKTYALDGECAFRFQFNGATAPARTLQRNLNVQNFAKNDVVELRGMVKANGLTAGARLALKVVYKNGSTEAVNVTLTAGSYDYAPFTKQITLKRPAKKITVQIRAGSAKGTFFVDDMAVVKVESAPLTPESDDVLPDMRGVN